MKVGEAVRRVMMVAIRALKTIDERLAAATIEQARVAAVGNQLRRRSLENDPSPNIQDVKPINAPPRSAAG